MYLRLVKLKLNLELEIRNRIYYKTKFRTKFLVNLKNLKINIKNRQRKNKFKNGSTAISFPTHGAVLTRSR